MIVQKPSYWIAVVDPSRNFARPIEIHLREAFCDYDVFGYDSALQFLEAIDEHPLQVPLLVIADIWAREPSIQDGVFNKAHIKVPRIRGIYFSSQPLIAHCKQMLQLGVLAGIVERGSEDDIKQLRSLVEQYIESLESSVDYWIINRLAEQVKQIPNPESYSVQTEQGTLSISQILIEVARKTALGELISRNLLSTYLPITSSVPLLPDVAAPLDIEPPLDPWWTRLLSFLRIISRPLCFLSIVGGILIIVVSCMFRYFDMAVLGIGALLIGLVYIAEKD